MKLVFPNGEHAQVLLSHDDLRNRREPFQRIMAAVASLGPADVLIEPDLGDISAASFARSKDAIRIGEEATRKLIAELVSDRAVVLAHAEDALVAFDLGLWPHGLVGVVRKLYRRPAIRADRLADQAEGGQRIARHLAQFGLKPPGGSAGIALQPVLQRIDEGPLARGWFVAPTVGTAPLDYSLWQEEKFVPLVLIGYRAEIPV